MRVFILGTGKSGTTALLYKVAGGLPNCQAFSGGKPGKYLGNYENAVYKHTYEERKGKSFKLYREHLSKESYDRKIWMARDPRDAAVSRMLYRWHRGYSGKRKQYRAHLNLVLKKEQDPMSVPFYEICRYTGHDGWPRTKTDVFEEEKARYQQMREFVVGLGNDWFRYRYEDMVDKKNDALNEYLGFETDADAEVPSGTGKDKVVRKKAYGDWRHWYTQDDVALFKPAYLSYMDAVGYDCNDWNLSPKPIIEPKFSSRYMQSLPHKAKKNLIMRFLDNFSQRFYPR
ncbi:MAG: hypothetical protein JRE65_10300 [Deltaproteobacteria bacterium]|jgi:hypothetical protein|nr:hypothetical protein [Deltaproteobacteria bacterium]